MKRLSPFLVALSMVVRAWSLHAEEAPIDPVRGRPLMQKASRGETLTDWEKAYLERVKKGAGVWLKDVEANPKPFGEFPAQARESQQDITSILQIEKHHYPNLRMIYLIVPILQPP